MKVNYQLSYICAVALVVNLFKPGSCESNWSGERLSLSDVSIVTDDGAGRATNDTTKYRQEDYGLSFQYAFKAGAKYIEVKHRDETVWTYNDNESECYPTAICVHLDLREIDVQAGKRIFAYKYNNGLWALESTQDLTQLPETGIKLYNGSSSNQEIQSDGYSVERRSVSVNYHLKTDTNCTRITYNGRTFWEFGNGQKEHPTMVHFNLFKKIVSIISPSGYLVYNYRPNGCTFVSKTDIANIPLSLLTIITRDNGDTILKENDYTTIFLKKHDSISEFTFNEESPCVEVKFGSTTVWSYNDQQSKGHPKAMFLNKDMLALFIEFEESTNIYMCNENGCEFIKHFDLEGFTPSKLTVVTNAKTGTVINDPNSFSTKSFGIGTEYTFKPWAKCVEVKFDGQTVWTPSIHNSNKHPKKLFIQPYTKMLFVDFNTSYSVYLHSCLALYVPIPPTDIELERRHACDEPANGRI